MSQISKKTHTTILFTIVSLFLMSNSTMAAPVPIDTSALDRSLSSDSKFGLGFTQSIAQRPFTGVDEQTFGLPYISYRNQGFYIEGLNVGYKLFTKNSFNLEILATPRFYEVKSSFASNGELDGIDETRPTYLAGFSAQYSTKPIIFTFQVLQDLLESDGLELIGSASKAFHISDSFSLSPTLAVTYQDSDLVDHFYGVQSHEVAANRSAYGGNSTTNYSLALTTIWDISKHIQLLGQLKYEALGSGITNSPIIDKDSINTGVIGAVYRF